MARFEHLPENVLETVARDVGGRLGRVIAASKETSLPGTPELFTFADATDIDTTFALTGAEPAGTPTSMAESFPVWVLKASALAQTSDDIRQLAENTDRWHHQIKIDNKAATYALSAPAGPESSERSVRELFESILAEKIDNAIEVIDNADVPDTYVVRLLKLPAYQIEAFWLLDEDSGDQSVLLIECAEGTGNLELNSLYDAGEFLTTLRRLPVVRGLASEGELGSNIDPLKSTDSDGGFDIDIRITIRQPKNPSLSRGVAKSEGPTCVTLCNEISFVTCLGEECESNRGGDGKQ